MKNGYAPIVHHGLKVAILLGFAGYLINLAVTGEILLFVAPHLLNYVYMAAAGLSLFAIFQFYITIRSMKQPITECACSHHHDHSHGGHSHDHTHGEVKSRSAWKHTVLYGLFVMPLLLAALLPNQAFAGALAKGGGVRAGETAVYDSNGVPIDLAGMQGSTDPKVKAMFTTDKYNRDYAKLGMLLYQQDVIEMKDAWFIEKMQSLNLFVNDFAGKQIKIKGFIYRENGLADNQLIIGRMAMTHCIADISPYGFVAELPDASRYANDSWVTITGTIDKTTFHEQPAVKIKVQQVEPATAPSIPYVYPDWDFGKKLK